MRPFMTQCSARLSFPVVSRTIYRDGCSRVVWNIGVKVRGAIVSGVEDVISREDATVAPRLQEPSPHFCAFSIPANAENRPANDGCAVGIIPIAVVVCRAGFDEPRPTNNLTRRNRS